MSSILDMLDLKDWQGTEVEISHRYSEMCSENSLSLETQIWEGMRALMVTKYREEKNTKESNLRDFCNEKGGGKGGREGKRES